MSFKCLATKFDLWFVWVENSRICLKNNVNVMSCCAQIVKRKALLWSGAAFLFSLSDGAAVSSLSSVVLTSLLPWSGAALLILLLWSGVSFQLLAFGRCCFSCSFFGWCRGFLLLLAGVYVSSSSWVVLLSPPPLILWCGGFPLLLLGGVAFSLLHYYEWCGGFLPLLWVVLISSLFTTALFSFQCYIDTLRTWHDMFRISWLSENTFYLNRWNVNWIYSDRMNKNYNEEKWIILIWIKFSYTKK